MRYQHLKTLKKITKYIGLILPLVIIFLLLTLNPKVPNFIVSNGHSVAQPFWSLQGYFNTKLHAISSYFSNKQVLQSENAELKSLVSELQRKVFMTNSLQAENERLLTLLGHTTQNSGLLTASVLHNKNYIAKDLFLIDIGAREGVRNNMLILSPEKIAIGYIVMALEDTSIVKRFSAPDVMFTAVINSSSTIQTAFYGQGSGSIIISLPRDVVVQEKDTIMLPSLSVYPIGEVVSIEVTPEDAFKTLYIRTPVNIYNLRHIIIDTTVIWNADDIDEQFEFQITPNEKGQDE